MWYVSGTAVSLQVEFQVGGESVIPDAGSVNVSVRDTLGVVIDALVDNPAVLSTALTMSIPAVHNTLAQGKSIETRYVTVSFSYEGDTYYIERSYRLTAFVALGCVATDVRRMLGLQIDELPDSDIDLYQAYYELKAKEGEAFTTALAESDLASIQASECITLKAAIALLPTLPMRVMQAEKTEGASFTRSKLDFEKLERDLKAQLANQLEQLRTTLQAAPVYFSVSTPIDPVTGA